MRLNTTIKRLTKYTLQRIGIPRAIGQIVNPHAVVILRYHSIANEPTNQADTINPGITHTGDVFRQHLEILLKTCHPTTLEELASSFLSGSPMPRRSFILTFDDGFADNFLVAAPIMENYGVYGAFYLTADCIEKASLPWFCRIHYAFQKTRRKYWQDPLSQYTWKLQQPSSRTAAIRHYNSRCASTTGEDQEAIIAHVESQLLEDITDRKDTPRMMYWHEAQQLIDHGHIVGNHTTSHPNIAYLDTHLMRQEIERAHDLLKMRLNMNSFHFSYPHPCLSPHWTQDSVSLIRSLGYKTSVTTDYGVANMSSDILLLPRVYAPHEKNEFRWVLDAAFAGFRT
jgi:peptidoglycan/xylan/chitin deacetylase (PgdA/CDA1 family)